MTVHKLPHLRQASTLPGEVVSESLLQCLATSSLQARAANVQTACTAICRVCTRSQGALDAWL